ncbi:hypothetical protein BC828DRAFT_405844 [Blastocladiella britannica]|nr:hypothetical protein BC828DRAFT_405844 [Blastocladiella britannica]
MVAPSGTAYKPVAPLASGEAECGGCARFWSARGKRRDLRLEGPDFGTRAPVVDVVVLRSAVFEAEDNELAPAITISNGIASATSSSFTIITSSIAPSSIAPTAATVTTKDAPRTRFCHGSRLRHYRRPPRPAPAQPFRLFAADNEALRFFLVKEIFLHLDPQARRASGLAGAEGDTDADRVDRMVREKSSEARTGRRSEHCLEEIGLMPERSTLIFSVRTHSTYFSDSCFLIAPPRSRPSGTLRPPFWTRGATKCAPMIGLVLVNASAISPSICPRA